jgi:hypothetical protein
MLRFDLTVGTSPRESMVPLGVGWNVEPSDLIERKSGRGRSGVKFGVLRKATLALNQMRSRNQTVLEETETVRILESQQDVATLRKILKEIVEGPAFKGSHRSGQFLEFVVEQAIAGNFDQLKERLIGVHFFNRPPSYDTGEDAIVRVTASDVRKRLLQHYGWFGAEREFRIDLPSGSYIPRLSRKSQVEAPPESALDTPPKPENVPAESVAEEPNSKMALMALQEPTEVAPPAVGPKNRWALWRYAAILAVAAILGWSVHSLTRPAPPSTTFYALPWSALFSPSAATRLITSDPAIDAVQGITKTNLSLSDYANHRYIPNPDKLTPEQIRFCKTLLSGETYAAAPDPPTAAKVAQIAPAFSKKLAVQDARSFQLSYLSNNDNFIFLGSPRSNPWFSLFADKLSFKFVFDPLLGSEFIRNVHARPHEQEAYVPNANGGGTGYTFALIAFIQNPDQNGQVLLLAGANGEGTAAAGELATDPQRISRALQNCGITSSGPTRHFEMLLRTEIMAGVSRQIEVMACHILPGA